MWSYSSFFYIYHLHTFQLIKTETSKRLFLGSLLGRVVFKTERRNVFISIILKDEESYNFQCLSVGFNRQGIFLIILITWLFTFSVFYWDAIKYAKIPISWDTFLLMLFNWFSSFMFFFNFMFVYLFCFCFVFLSSNKICKKCERTCSFLVETLEPYVLQMKYLCLAIRYWDVEEEILK